MPIYEYRCDECGELFEKMQKITDAPLKKCISCGGSAHRIISKSTFILKGTGWYVTDYPSKDRTRAQSSEKSKSSSTSTTSSSSSSSSSSTDSSSPASSSSDTKGMSSKKKEKSKGSDKSKVAA